MRVLTEKIRKNYTHHTTTNKPQTIQTFSCGGCSRPLYSSHTTPHTTNNTTTTAIITGSHSLLAWCEHQDQPINNGLLSQTPNSAPTNYLEKLLPVYASKNSCYQPLYGWRCVSTPIQQWWHDHIRAINHQPNNTIETSTWWVI